MPSASSTNGWSAAGQGVGFGGEDERGFAVAEPRIFIGGQDVGDKSEDLKIVRLKLRSASWN